MDSRERPKQPTPPDVKRGGLAEKGPGFFERALATLRSWGGPKPTESKSLSRLEGLKSSDKKRLVSDVAFLKNKDVQEGKPDVRSHVFELFADEVADGVIEIDDLHVLADVLSEHVANRPKKPDAQYIDNLKFKITSVLNNLRRPLIETKGPGAVENKEAEIAAKVLPLAEKMLNAPTKFIADMGSFAQTLQAEMQAQEAQFLSQTHGELGADQVRKIIEQYPDNYEQVTAILEGVMAKASVLEATGMSDCAHAVKDLSMTYSPVDGAVLRTPHERAAYVETLLSPGELKAQWYATKPKEYSKDFSLEFVAAQAIPTFLRDNTPVEEVVKQIHWLQTAGSKEQFTLAQKGVELAGTYRTAELYLGDEEGGIRCPEAKHVPELMKAFSAQFDSFSAQLEQKRNELSPEEFEQKVFEYACYVLQRLTDIHPMADGNGRTSRSLFEYTIAKHLGPEKMKEYSARYLTKAYESGLDHRLRNEQKNITNTERMNTFTFRPGMDMESSTLLSHLEQTDINTEVFENPDFRQFASTVREVMTQNKKTAYTRA